MIGTLHHWLAIWWPIIGHLTGAGIAVIGLLAFTFATPTWLLPGLKKPALWAAAALALCMGTAMYFDRMGANRVRADWDWELQQEATAGEQIRTDADSAARVDTPDSVRNDPRNRDNRK